jgi:uncharacterized protein YndB with AHSA1/START domain
MSNNSKASRGPKITIERRYRASLEDVWDLWTTKEGFESWWGPQGFRAEVHELDARPGGALRYDMVADSAEMIAAMKQMGQPERHPTHSTFTELLPQRRILLTNVIDFLVGVEPYQSQIGVDLWDEGGSVRMVVTLDQMHNAEFTKMQQDGFTRQLSKLDARFPAA